MNSNTRLDSKPLRSMFTLSFLQALVRINNLQRPSSSFPSTSLRRRGQKIKRATDVAAAAATGAKQAWSRAVLWKVQLQAMHRASARPESVARKKSHSRADKLCRFVLGDEAMDFFNLLEETSDYIQSLTTQVHVMKTLADSSSL